jgi:hypothetical protein
VSRWEIPCAGMLLVAVSLGQIADDERLPYNVNNKETVVQLLMRVDDYFSLPPLSVEPGGATTRHE